MTSEATRRSGSSHGSFQKNSVSQQLFRTLGRTTMASNRFVPIPRISLHYCYCSRFKKKYWPHKSVSSSVRDWILRNTVRGRATQCLPSTSSVTWHISRRRIKATFKGRLVDSEIELTAFVSLFSSFVIRKFLSPTRLTLRYFNRLHHASFCLLLVYFFLLFTCVGYVSIEVRTTCK